MSIIASTAAMGRRLFGYLRVQRRYYDWNNLVVSNLRKLGGGKLSKNQIDSIREFYNPYFKVGLSAHKFYTTSTGTFYVNYVPDPMFYAYIDPFFNDWEMAKYMDNKCNYRNMFPGALQPTLISYRMNGYWYDSCGRLIKEEKAIRLIVDSGGDCFVKQAADSLGGKGVYYVKAGTSVEEIAKLVNKITNDVVVQEGLTQSDILSKINDSSVNTIRLLTMLRKDGSVKIYSVILRMGINGAKVDNASSGGITVGVEDNGQLKSIAYSADGRKFEEHPTSHVKFNDFVIPNFDKIKELVKEQATYYPHFRLISWDIALNKDNQPVIIEANLCNGEIDFHQLNNGPLFGEDTEEILKEVFGEK